MGGASRVITFRQTLNIPVVRVCTAKKSTAPKSLAASIITRAIPAKTAGRANGTTLKKRPTTEMPNDFATSSAESDCSKNAERAIK